MSEYSPYDEQKVKTKKKKSVKVTPKTIFGVFCGTFFLFVVSFLLSYMLMNHSLPAVGTKSLEEENEELKAKIERLEERLEKYEDVDDFADTQVPDKYTGATITPGGSEPASTKSNTDKEDKKETDSIKNNYDKADNDSSNNTSDEEESAFEGVINDDKEPSTGISDAPVILN